MISYESLVYGSDAFRSHAENSVDLIVVDEAHFVKRNSTHRSRAIASLMSRCRIGLTATPLSNNVDELYCLLSLFVPGVLGGPGDFKTLYAEPISAGGPYAALVMQELHEVLERVFLARKLEDLKLPPKTESVVSIHLSQLERDVYAAICAETTPGGKPVAVLAKLTKLEKACMHAPSLLRGDNVYGEVVRSKWPSLPERPETLLELASKTRVAKLLIEIILERGGKVVVISDLVKKRDGPVALLVRHFRNYLKSEKSVVVLKGDVPSNNRQLSLAAFNCGETGGPRICVLSGKMAIGLNLVGADHLVLLSPSWNPVDENQKLGRIHRMGQQAHTFHYRLVTHGTIEESKINRQESKDRLK